MQSSRTNKKKSIRKSLCGACLCADRKLNNLLEFGDIFQLICKNVVEDINTKTLVCFECLALLRNVIRFQEKVLKSQIILKNNTNDYFEKNLLNGLSNLSTTVANVLEFSEPLNNEEFNSNDDDQKNNIDINQDTLKIEDEELDTNDINSFDYEPLEEEIKNSSPPGTDTKEEILPIETEIDTKEENIQNVLQYFRTKPIAIKITGQKEVKEEKCENSENNKQNLQNECQPPSPKSSDTRVHRVCRRETHTPREKSQTVIKKKKNKETNREPRIRCLLIRPRSEMYKFIETHNSAAYKVIEIPYEEIRYWMDKERNSSIFRNALYKCEKCALTIEQKKLKEHARRHSNPLKLICDYCTLSFAKKHHLRKHIKKHRYIRCCAICDFKGIGSDHMYKHAYKEHGRRNKIVQCLTCNTLLKSAREFYKHYRNEHYQDDTKFICDYCNKKCASRTTLEKHIFNHHIDHKCKICNTTYKTPTILKTHMGLKHTIERSEASYCVTCDRQFDNIRAFKRHLSRSVAHVDERKVPKKIKSKKPHPCPEPSCPKVYTNSSNMKAHYSRVHTNDNKYQCLQCNKRFFKNGNLKIHIQYHHEGCVRERKHLCTICGRKFTESKILKNHIRTHTGERPYECPHCESKFGQRTAMVTHMRNIHKEKARNPQSKKFDIS